MPLKANTQVLIDGEMYVVLRTTVNAKTFEVQHIMDRRQTMEHLLKTKGEKANFNMDQYRITKASNWFANVLRSKDHD